MNMDQLLDQVNQCVKDQLVNMDRVRPVALNLDPRSCDSLWLDEQNIVVEKRDHARINYYGGFEYIDTESVAIIGDYVIYTNTDRRVNNHIRHYYEVGIEN